MPIDLANPVRRELLARAGEYAGPILTAQAATTTFAGGLEVQLADAARAAAAALADAPTLRAALARGRELLDAEIAPGSPLQSWRMVYALLDGGGPETATLPGGAPLAAAQQVRGIEDFVRLEVAPQVLQLSRAALEQALTLAEAAGVRVDRARASLAQRVGDVDAALQAVETWIARAGDDPDAYVARLRCRIARGDVDWAAFDGARAVGLAVDPDAAKRTVIGILDAAAEAGRAPAERWRQLARSFEGGD